MNRYADRIWTAIQAHARLALEALEPHVNWHSLPGDPKCGVDYIGSGALSDPSVPTETRSHLGDISVDHCSLSDGDSLPVWPTVHVLDALRTIAKCHTRQHAFASLPELPHRDFLSEWVAEARMVSAAMRIGGPDVDPEAAMAHLYAKEQSDMMKSVIWSCALHVEGWAMRLSEEENEKFWSGWNCVVEGHH